jgi:hypothetical protein
MSLTYASRKALGSYLGGGQRGSISNSNMCMGGGTWGWQGVWGWGEGAVSATKTHGKVPPALYGCFQLEYGCFRSSSPLPTHLYIP